MKKRLLFFVLPFILFGSCKKNNESKYYITCDIDGVSKSFNFDAIASTYKNGQYTYFGAGGFDNASTDAEEMYVEVSNVPREKVIGPGTYADTSVSFEARIEYTLGNGAFYEGGTYLRILASQTGKTVDGMFVITITSLDENSFSGTFTGNCFLETNASGPEKHITNGKFYVPFR